MVEKKLSYKWYSQWDIVIGNKFQVNDDKPVGKGTKTTLRKAKRDSLQEYNFSRPPFNTSLPQALRLSLRSSKIAEKFVTKRNVTKPPSKIVSSYTKGGPQRTETEQKKIETKKNSQNTNIFKIKDNSKNNLSKTQFREKAKAQITALRPDLSPYLKSPSKGFIYNYTLGHPKKPIVKKTVVNRSPPEESSESEISSVTKYQDSEGSEIEYKSDFEDPTESERTNCYSASNQESKTGSDFRTLSYLSSISSNDASFGSEESKNDPKSPKDSPDDDIEINSYSDDFEDYESDFEDERMFKVESTDENEISDVETASETESEMKKIVPERTPVVILVEEERKADSSVYDISTKPIKSDIFRMSQLKEIKEAILRENAIYNERLKFYKNKII